LGSNTSEPAQGLFARVDNRRVSQTIADRLRTLIRTGQLAVGERLPPERELCESFGVSRVALREALRVLETNGLIQIKVGAGGGAVVTAPTAGQIGQGITDLLSMSALSATDVTEARRIIELGIVPIVCERATEEDVADLQALCDAAAEAREKDHYSVDVSFDFHLRIAAATHNPAVVMLLRSFREPILMSLSEAHHTGIQGVDEHREFVDAISRRDASQATAIMARHLQRTAARVAKS
jgi:GntR family transcriptional repressor for pyruvate dehydrogenase complex